MFIYVLALSTYARSLHGFKRLLGGIPTQITIIRTFFLYHISNSKLPWITPKANYYGVMIQILRIISLTRCSKTALIIIAKSAFFIK